MLRHPGLICRQVRVMLAGEGILFAVLAGSHAMRQGPVLAVRQDW